jgi:hypothetical protein
MPEQKTTKELIEIVKTGMISQATPASLETQLLAIEQLSKIPTPEAVNCIRALEDFNSKQVEGDSDCYRLQLTYPNAGGELEKELAYSVYVNDTAPEGWGELKFNSSPAAKRILQCIEKVGRKRELALTSLIVEYATKTDKKEGINLEENICYCKILDEHGVNNGVLPIYEADGPRFRTYCQHCEEGQCGVASTEVWCPYR